MADKNSSETNEKPNDKSSSQNETKDSFATTSKNETKETSKTPERSALHDTNKKNVPDSETDGKSSANKSKPSAKPDDSTPKQKPERPVPPSQTAKSGQKSAEKSDPTAKQKPEYSTSKSCPAIEEDISEEETPRSDERRPSLFSFFGNFHPLRALRNIFFGYKKDESENKSEKSPEESRKRRRAQSTDALNETPKSPNRVSAVFSRISGKRSRTLDKRQSRSVDHLAGGGVDEDWIPARQDGMSKPDLTNEASVERADSKTKEEKRQRVKSSTSSDVNFSAPVIIEEDWANEFFTEGWSLNKQHSRQESCEAGIDEMDAIGAECTRLDSKLAKDRLAVKQKGKRMSSAVILKASAHPASDTRSPLISVMEAPELTEKPVKKAIMPPKPTAKPRPEIKPETEEKNAAGDADATAPQASTVAGESAGELSLPKTPTPSSSPATKRSEKETSASSTTDAHKPPDVLTRMPGLKPDPDAARKSIFMEDLKASVQRSSSRRGQGPPKVMPKKKALDNADHTESKAEAADAAKEETDGACISKHSVSSSSSCADVQSGTETLSDKHTGVQRDKSKHTDTTTQEDSSKGTETDKQSDITKTSDDTSMHASINVTVIPDIIPDVTTDDKIPSTPAVPITTDTSHNSQSKAKASNSEESTVETPSIVASLSDTKHSVESDDQPTSPPTFGHLEPRTSTAQVSLRTLKATTSDPTRVASMLSIPGKVFRAHSPGRVKSTIGLIGELNPRQPSPESGLLKKEKKSDEEKMEEGSDSEGNQRIYARLKHQEMTPPVRQMNRKRNKSSDNVVTKL